MHHFGNLPGEIHGIADSGIHALPAHRTVDVCRIAKQECASLAKVIGDAVMNTVGREPADALDVDGQPLEDALTHVVPGQVSALTSVICTHRPNETGMPVTLQWEHDQEISCVQRAMQLAVHD